MDIYTEVENTILNLKYDRANKKIYKFILILSLFDYYEDLNIENSPYNKFIEAELLLPYYRLYLEQDALKEITYANTTNVLRDTKILSDIYSNPLRHIVTGNNIFKNNDTGYLEKTKCGKPSKKKKYLPTRFMIEIPGEFDEKLMTQTIKKACYRKIYQITGVSLDFSVVTILNSKPEINTELIKIKESYARTGQGQYRQKLLDKFECTCALCEINFINMLVASHAKPWRSCDSVHEKLSENNGLLLCANHDQLFDKGYITIDPKTNKILVSSQVDSHQQEKFKTSIMKEIKLSQAEYKYFTYHSTHIFKK